MLDLNHPRWSELSHAYGRADNIPPLIDQLRLAAAQHEAVLEDWNADPWVSLWSALFHQETVYTASYATVPHIVAIAATQARERRIICLAFAGCVALAQHEDGAPAIPPDLAPAYTTALQQAANLILDCLTLDWSDDDYKILLGSLVTVRGHALLGEAIFFL